MCVFSLFSYKGEKSLLILFYERYKEFRVYTPEQVEKKKRWGKTTTTRVILTSEWRHCTPRNREIHVEDLNMVGSVVSPGPTIKMLDLGDHHPVRKLLHAAWWYAAIPWHLWIGVSTIPRAKNLLCRSVSGINHHYEPGPMNPPLWPSTSKLFLFHDSPDKIKDWETPSSLAKTKTQRKKVQIVSLKSGFQISFCFCHIMKKMKKGKSSGWQNHYLVWVMVVGMDGVNGFCFPMPLSWMLWWDWHFGDLPWNEDYYCSWPFSTLH